MHQYKKNLTVLALLIAFTTAVVAVEVNTTSELQKGSFQGTHLQDGEIRLGPGANDDALVGYWNFESKVPNKVVDASGNGNNGTLYGEEKNGKLKNFDFNAESGWVSGKNGGNALRFDGSDDYVLLNNSDDFDVSEENELTISAWIKSMEVRDEPYRYIFSNSRDCCGDYGGYNLKVDNDLTAEIWDGIDQETISYNYSSHFNKWTHVTFAATGSDVKIFINGNLVKEAKQNLSIASPSFDSHIGALSYNPSLYNFNGSIDSLRLYNRSLSSSEISGVYSGKEDPRRGLIGEWTFDSGSGEIVHDTSKWQKGIRQGKSLEFDGSDDYVDIGRYSFREDLTLSAWFKNDGGSSVETLIASDDISSTGTDGERNQFKIYKSGSNELVFSVDDGSGTFPTVKASGYMDGEWHQAVAKLVDSNEMHLLVDGDLKDSKSVSQSDTIAPDQMTGIGTFYEDGTLTRMWVGKIDNLRIYSRGLSDSELRKLYNPSPGYFTSGFVDSSTTRWNELNWTQNLAQNTDIEGRVQTASEVKETSEYSEWFEGSSSYSGPTEGLVGYWRFENNVSGSGGTFKDWSGNGNDGKTKNGVNTSVEGFRPQSNTYGFDGKDDHIDISSSSELTGFNQFTITTLVKTGTWHEFFEKAGQHGMRFRTSPNDFYMWTEFQSAGKVELFLSNDLPDNKWMTVAMTYNGSHLKGMIDGKVEAIKNVGSDQVVNNNNNIVLAPETGGTGYNNRFNKKIDELRVYDRALTPSELRAIHTSGSYTSDWIKASNVNWAKWKQTQKGKDLKPMAQWRFDEGSGQWANDSAGDSDGKLGASLSSESSDPTWKNDCRFRGCLEFDGEDDYIDADIPGLPDPMKEVTVSFWTRNNGNGSDSVINAAPDDTSNRLNIHLPWENNDALYWDFGSTSGGGRLSHTWKDSEWENEWNHWTFVSDLDSGQRIYVNGELLKSDSDADSFSRGSKSLNIMSYSGTPSYMQGSLDDLRIYNRSLSDSEIKALYNSPSQSFSSSSLQVRSRDLDSGSSSLLASYNFEGVAQSVADSNGEGNPGTLGTTANDESSDPQRVSGLSGQAVKFDGIDDYVRVNDGKAFEQDFASSGISFSAWFKLGEEKLQRLWGGDGKSTNWLLTAYSDGRLGFSYRSSSTNEYVIADSGYSKGKWHHVTGTYDSSNTELSIFVDGELVNTAQTTNHLDNPKGYNALGGYGTSSYVNGALDEVRIYDKPLSEPEVEKLYNLSGFTSASSIESGSNLSLSDLNIDGQSFDSKYYQFKLNSLTGTSRSVPEVESVTLADTSGWSDWVSSPGSGLDLGSSSLVQAQFNLSSSEPDRSPELSAFSILEGLKICDRRGSLNECIVDAAHSMASEIIDITSIFESKDSAELTSSGTATLNITNSSTLSGNWFGSFEIRSEDPTVKPGAEFKPENGDIVIGK